MEFRKKRRDSTSPDITPMVDVVFLLLIFFMLSTTFIVSPGIKINLPQAKAESVRHEKKDLRVKINAKGTIFFGEKRVESSDELMREFRESAKSDADSLVIIEADEETAHKYVVSVMDSAKTSGLRRLAIATKPSR